MQTIDILILASIGIFFLFGFVRGFIKQLGALVGFFLSVWAAGAFYQQLVPQVKPFLKEYPLIADPLSVAVSYIGLYIAVSIAFHLLVRILDQIFRIFSFIPLFKTVNRLLGGLVGFIEGLLLLSFLVIVIGLIPLFPKTHEVFKKSTFVPWLEKVAIIIKPLIPEFKGLESLSPETLLNQKTLESIDPKILQKFIEQYKKSPSQKPPEQKK